MPVAENLLDAIAATPAGQISPSIYETARLVALATWVPGQEERLRFLFASQNADGTWGMSPEYAFIPTLSALDALLAALSHNARGVGHAQLRSVLESGLAGMAGLFESPATFADMIATE